MNHEGNRNEDNYNKIKHLFEVDFNILAVFVLTFEQMKELHTATDSPIADKDIELIK